MSNADEITHLVKLLAGQESATKTFVYGTISNYDPNIHRVRVQIPSMRDENDNMTLSPWMPLGTPWAGNGFGLQVAPKGGEQCVVLLITAAIGVSATAFMTFNNSFLPPLASLQPGEAILKHGTGSFIRLHTNGDIEVNTAGRVILTAAGDTDVTATGNVNVTATGTANVTAPAINLGDGGTLQELLNAASATIYNEHTHPTPDGTSGPPNQLMGSGQMTSVVKAQ
jgi:phage gp45-like